MEAPGRMTKSVEMSSLSTRRLLSFHSACGLFFPHLSSRFSTSGYNATDRVMNAGFRPTRPAGRAFRALSGKGVTAMAWTQGRALKICVIGDPGVGKTSLVRRLAEGSFEERYITTVGAAAWTVSIRLSIPGFRRPLHQKLVLWDVTGHGGPEAIGPFLRGADAALVVSDAARPDTQMNMWKWVEGVRMAAGSLPIMLVVNKTDISGPYIDPGTVMQQAREYGTLYRRTSAWTGRNVSSAISDLVVWHRGPWSAIEGRPAGPHRFPRIRRQVGRIDRRDVSAGFRPGDPGPAGLPDPHGSCVVGSTGRALS